MEDDLGINKEGEQSSSFEMNGEYFPQTEMYLAYSEGIDDGIPTVTYSTYSFKEGELKGVDGIRIKKTPNGYQNKEIPFKKLQGKLIFPEDYVKPEDNEPQKGFKIQIFNY